MRSSSGGRKQQIVVVEADERLVYVVNFGIGIVLLMAGTAISRGAFSVGDFALFVSYLWFTTQVPSEIGTFYGDYKTQAVSIERLMELIRPEPPRCWWSRIPSMTEAPCLR